MSAPSTTAWPEQGSASSGSQRGSRGAWSRCGSRIPTACQSCWSRSPLTTRCAATRDDPEGESARAHRGELALRCLRCITRRSRDPSKRTNPIADYERSISAAGRGGARAQMFPFGAAFDRPGPLRPRRRLSQQPPGLDRRGPCPHLAGIASSALTATAAREALCGSTPTPPPRSGCRARQAQASHTSKVHDRSRSGAQADGAAIPCAGKVPKPAPDAGRLGARR